MHAQNGRGNAALIVLLGMVCLAFGYWIGTQGVMRERAEVGTSGISDSVERTREAGARVGESVAAAGQTIAGEVNEASLTAKIKAKMALDDAIKARSIDVTTEGSTVILSGSVGSIAERERAVTLTRETEGVRQVIDRLQVQ
jgi:osmotically-inducible protein OsmY